jgi:hypothetical protein
MARNQNLKSTAASKTQRAHGNFFSAVIGFTAIAVLAFLPRAARAQQANSSSGSSSQSTSSSAPAATTAQAPPADPLAAAARKAREQQSQVKKPAKVFTNDNLPTAGGISTVGVTSTAAPADQSSSAAPAAQGEKYWRDKFASLNKKLEQDQAELDVMQRELGQLNLQNYSDPVEAMQQGYSRGDIDKKTADIDAKQKEIEADKQAISDAQDDLRKAGGDPGWAR